MSRKRAIRRNMARAERLNWFWYVQLPEMKRRAARGVARGRGRRDGMRAAAASELLGAGDS